MSQMSISQEKGEMGGHRNCLMKGTLGNSLYLLNIILKGTFYVGLFLSKHFPRHITVYKLPSCPSSYLTLSTVLRSIQVLLSTFYRWGYWGYEWDSELLKTSTVLKKNDPRFKPRFWTTLFPLCRDRDTFYQMVSHPKISQVRLQN